MTPERFYAEFCATNTIRFSGKAEHSYPFTLAFARAFASHILAAYRATQEEDAGKMAPDFFKILHAAELDKYHDYAVYQLWFGKYFMVTEGCKEHCATVLPAILEAAEAYHQYRASQEERSKANPFYYPKEGDPQ